MQQTLATILFFLVFIELFLALTIYLAVSIYTFLVKSRKDRENAKRGNKETRI